MLTVIYGTDSKLINSEIKHILNLEQLDDTCIVKDSSSLEEFYFFSLQSNLFLTPRAYIFYNDDVFVSLNEFKKSEQMLFNLSNNKNNIIIVTTKKPSATKTVNDFLGRIKYIEVKQLDNNNKYTYIKELFVQKQIHLSSDEIDLLVNKLPNDANIIAYETDKLFNYKDINIDVIKQLVCDYKQFNVFELVNACFKQDLARILYIYESFFKMDPDLNYIFHIFALQISQLLVFSELKQQGYDYNQICDTLGINYYSYKTINDLSKVFPKTKVLDLIDNLYKLDVKLKRNVIDKNSAFKYFLLKLFRWE